MMHLADIASFQTIGGRFVPHAGPCVVCGRLVNEQMTVRIAGSVISVFACGGHEGHGDKEIVDEIVWHLATQLREGRNSGKPGR